MESYLHFIGKSNYTIDAYKSEAKEQGASRRISLTMLNKMHWGDLIFCCMLDGKSPILFGFFELEQVGGWSREVLARMFTTEHTFEKISDGGETVNRGCGSYQRGACLLTDITIQEMVMIARTVDNYGKPMIQGTFYDLREYFTKFERDSYHAENLPEEIRLKDIPFQRGFRLFDWDSCYKEAIELQRKGKYIHCKGQFYVWDETFPETDTEEQQGRILEVLHYQKGR